jgi:hypothetical protein
MTDTATKLAVGDRVLVTDANSGRFGQVGALTGIDDKGPTLLYCNVVTFDDGRGGHYTADELERIDVEPEAAADDAAVSAGVEGQPVDDCRCARTIAELAAEESPVPTVEALAAQVAALTERVSLLETLMRAQAKLVANFLDPMPVDGTFRHLDGAPRTTKRVHTKVVKNTKGYAFEISTEVTSDDPILIVNNLNSILRDQADLAVRRYIIDAQYRDDNGLPGDDEIDPDRPF